MAKAKRSGIVVHKADVPIILGMIMRNDRKHDIAAWFGLNQGRIAEVEDGTHGNPPAAPAAQMPPVGSPGPRARALRAEAQKVLQLLKKQTPADTTAALQRLQSALGDFDKDAD
jgi:hypothetical protein